MNIIVIWGEVARYVLELSFKLGYFRILILFLTPPIIIYLLIRYLRNNFTKLRNPKRAVIETFLLLFIITYVGVVIYYIAFILVVSDSQPVSSLNLIE